MDFSSRGVILRCYSPRLIDVDPQYDLFSIMRYDRSRVFLRLCSTLSHFYLSLFKIYANRNYAYSRMQLVVMYGIFVKDVRLNVWKLTICF